MEEIKIAKMTGSEKQVAWATDIITRPYTDMIRRIKIFEEQLHQPEHAAACRKAMATYREAYERASAMDPNMTIAARIIEKKSFSPLPWIRHSRWPSQEAHSSATNSTSFNKRRNIMKTITIYTQFEISAISFGVTHAKCWPEKPNFSHSESIGYELTITIPEDAMFFANKFGDVLLDIPGETFLIPLFYNDVANRIEGIYHEPINGVSILQKNEI